RTARTAGSSTYSKSSRSSAIRRIGPVRNPPAFVARRTFIFFPGGITDTTAVDAFEELLDLLVIHLGAKLQHSSGRTPSEATADGDTMAARLVDIAPVGRNVGPHDLRVRV